MTDILRSFAICHCNIAQRPASSQDISFNEPRLCWKKAFAACCPWGTWRVKKIAGPETWLTTSILTVKFIEKKKRKRKNALGRFAADSYSALEMQGQPGLKIVAFAVTAATAIHSWQGYVCSHDFAYVANFFGNFYASSMFRFWYHVPYCIDCCLCDCFAIFLMT